VEKGMLRTCRIHDRADVGGAFLETPEAQGTV
jgi:hypothetical protein